MKLLFHEEGMRYLEHLEERHTMFLHGILATKYWIRTKQSNRGYFTEFITRGL